MKKKIINGLLMMALTVATTSSFVSCTDTVSDDTAALKEMLANQDTRLTAALNQQIAGLQQQIKDLQTELQNSKCKCEIPFLQEYLDLLNNLQKELGDISGAISGGTGSTGGQNLASWIAQVNQKLKELDAQAKENKENIATNAGNIAQNTADIQTNANNIKLLLQQVTALQTALNDLEARVATNEGNIQNHEGRITANEANIAKLLACCETVNGIVSTLQTDLAELKAKVEALEGKYTQLTDSLKGLSIDERLKALEGLNIDDRIKALENLKIDERLQALESYKVTVDERFTQISDSLYNAYQRLNAAETRLDSIVENFATKKALNDSVEALRGEIDGIWDAMNLLYNNELYLLSLIQANQTAIAQNTSDIAQNTSDIATNTAAIAAQEITIGQMQEAITNLQAKDEDLQNQITALETRVANLEPRVAKNEEDIKKIFDALNKQVTGIIVQGAYSPVFGIGMLPVDAKTNILAAYVGTSGKAVEFPAQDATNYVSQSAFWTKEEAQFVDFDNAYKIGANKVLLSDAKDNAGKLYLTVNPSQVNFEGKLIELENSQGKAAPVLLSELKKSDYKLSFGWTRAAQNGFYEADAMITEADLKDAKARINVNALVTAAKDLYHTRSKASLKEAAQAIISSTDGDILDANAAKATYEGLPDENGKATKLTTFSEYSVATTVITPLSYNTLKDWNPNRIPGLDRVESVINRFFNKINVKFDFGIKTVAQMPQIDLITIPELDKQYYINVHIKQPIELKDIPVKVPGQWVEVKVDKTLESSVHVEIPYKHLNYATPDPDDYITETLKADVPYDVPIKFDEKVWVEGTTVYFSYTYNLDISQDVDITDIIKDLYGEVTQPIDGVNETLKSLQKFADEVNEMLKSIENLDARVNGQIEDMKNDIKNEIIGYMDRFEKKVLSYVPYVNQALQPVLLYKSTNGLARVSTIQKGASKMSGSVMFVPTNFNAELLSPAFKKYVVCTGAWKADGTFDAAAAKAANADSANQNFAKVIDGAERAVTFTGKAGYKYRIVYQALDYHGKIASGRYYVQF